MPKTSPLPLLANENVVFKVKSSVFVLVVKIIGLALLDVLLTYIFIKFDIAKTLGLESYSMWINLAPTIAIGMVAIIIFLDWLTTQYMLTNRRVEVTRGIFGTSSQSMSVDKINSVYEQESLPGIIFKYGTLVIKSASLGFQITFFDISDPDTKKQQIEDQMP